MAVGANWLSKVASRHKLKALRCLKRKPVATSSVLLVKQLLSHLIAKSKLRAFLLIQVHATAHRVTEDLIRDKNKLYISP